MDLDFNPDNTPKSTFIYNSLIREGYSAIKMGFQKPTDVVNRFIARFRLAKEFKEIKFDTYTSDTAIGYNSLVKVFLAYSAFEQFLEIMGKDRSSVNSILIQYNSTKHINYILREDKNKRFYDFLCTHLDKKRTDQKEEKKLTKVYNKSSDNIIYIASSIRHIFAHGLLSPSANRCKPETVKNICDCIFNFLIEVMDKEFSKKINTFKAGLK